MKIYLIGESPTEKIEFKADDPQFALVHTRKEKFIAEVTILNKRELLTLYQAIQGEILNSDTNTRRE